MKGEAVHVIHDVRGHMNAGNLAFNAFAGIVESAGGDVDRLVMHGPLAVNGGSCTEQISCALGQRVWNRQAVGGLAGLGTSPLSKIRWRLLSGGSGTGTADRSAPVYGWRGLA